MKPAAPVTTQRMGIPQGVVSSYESGSGWYRLVVGAGTKPQANKRRSQRVHGSGGTTEQAVVQPSNLVHATGETEAGLDGPSAGLGQAAAQVGGMQQARQGAGQRIHGTRLDQETIGAV